MKNLTRLIIIFLLAISYQLSNAQCAGYAKKVCKPELGEYMRGLSINSMAMRPGSNVEVLLTFFSGKEYRMMVCNDNYLENVRFKLFDIYGKLLFDSKKHNAKKFDFIARLTTQFKLRIMSDDVDDSAEYGCLSVMIGHKK